MSFSDKYPPVETLPTVPTEELLRAASDWIMAACTEHYDGGGPMPPENYGRALATEMLRRSGGNWE